MIWPKVFLSNKAKKRRLKAERQAPILRLVARRGGLTRDAPTRIINEVTWTPSWFPSSGSFLLAPYALCLRPQAGPKAKLR